MPGLSRRRYRLRFATRPLLGYIVQGKPIHVPVRYIYQVKHRRFPGLWLRDPYRAGAGDPRYDWIRDQSKAARYVSELLAERASLDSGHDGIVVPVQHSP